MLVEYLVTSRARRGLLRAVWARGMVGSVSELARAAGVVPSAAEREIAAMERLALVVVERSGNSKRVRANRRSPHARMLIRLFDPPAAPTTGQNEPDPVRAWLASYGAPLAGGRSSTGDRPPLEKALLAGLRASRRDAGVARVLPVVLWKNRKRLRHDELTTMAVKNNQARTLGFFLDLTAELTADSSFAAGAEILRDRRFRRPVMFFEGATSPLDRELAELNTPEVARRWNFLMNMGTDSFESMFRKATADENPHSR